jgi:predicted transposase YbfD/YdcC
LDKGHGRIERRQLWTASTDPAALGLAGVAQVVRIHRHTQSLRKGLVYKETDDVVFALTSLMPQQAQPERLLQIAREHWSIENGQHHRRDRTQREDSCTVRDTRTGRNLSLFRSLAIFLFEQQRRRKGAKASLPDLESYHHAHPWSLIRRLMDPPQL